MRYQDLTWPEIDALDRDRTILLLPVGSIEQHGHHMPVATDTLLADAVSMAAAEKHEGPALVLPCPNYGYSPHHMGFAGTITLKAETLIAVLTDIVGSVVDHGFRRIVMVNGHGGNTAILGLAATELGKAHYGKARIAGLTYFQLAAAALARLRRSEPGGMGHACEFETALLAHIRPDLVKGDGHTVYPDTGSRYLPTDLLAPGPIATYLDFSDLSASGTLGDPSLSTKEAGARFYSVAADELVRFLEDFGDWDIPGAQE